MRGASAEAAHCTLKLVGNAGRDLDWPTVSSGKTRKKYDELWRNTIWSDNERERAVLDILLADQRMYDASFRYSDVARGGL